MAENTRPVYTCVSGTNADLIEEIARLYLQPGMLVADVTYGKGVFWQKIDLKKIILLPSDIDPDIGVDVHDFRNLPYDDGAVDIVVLDPPYMHDPGSPSTNYNHNWNIGKSHNDIMQLYADGMREAYRVLSLTGQLWVKTQDEISSGKQCWSHIEIYNSACALGFYAQDLFVLARTAAQLQVKRQLHARKNHSYLWIFKKGK